MRIRDRAPVGALTLLLMSSWLAVATPAGQQPAPASGAAAGADAAAQPDPAALAAAEEADHAALRELRTVYEQAIRDGQLDALAPHLSADFHGVMVTGRVVKSLGDLQTFWSDIRSLLGEGGSYRTTLNPETSVLLDDIALARGTSDDVVVTGDGEEFRFTSYWTATLQKEGGVWKIRHVQGSIDPVDNPFVGAFRRRAVTLSAGVGGIAGIVLGGGLMLFLKRRRGRG